MPVGLFFQLLINVVRLTRLAPRVARILGLRLSGRSHRELRFGSYILYGVGMALAVTYFVYYLIGLHPESRSDARVRVRHHLQLGGCRLKSVKVVLHDGLLRDVQHLFSGTRLERRRSRAR